MRVDSLGDRIKNWYEDTTRFYLPRRTYTIMRIDGKAFHTWTKGLERPYDASFLSLMDETSRRFCSKVQGAVCAYTQSDEVSILLVDFDPEGRKLATSPWFDNNVQKLCSVGASMFTAMFNDLVPNYIRHSGKRYPAIFDARVFTIPDPKEVYNYFVWRQQDATRNSVQSAARFYYSDSECFGKNGAMLQEMLFQKGINWNDYPVRFKRGGFIYYDDATVEGHAVNKKTGEEVSFHRPLGWSVYQELPILTSPEGKEWMCSLIPKHPELPYNKEEGEDDK